MTPDRFHSSMEDMLMRARHPAPGSRAERPGLFAFLRGLGRPAPRAPLALEDALPCLFPKVRPVFAYQAYARRTGQPAPEYRLLAGDFAVSLVVDLPNQDLDLGPAHLRAWNLDFDSLLQRARGNLLARGGEQGFHAEREGCYRSTWRDSLDGSRMLLPGILQRLRIKGDPVVLLPNRDTLLVAGSEDPEALRWAMGLAREQLDRAICPADAGPLRLRHYRWESWDRPGAPEDAPRTPSWRSLAAFDALSPAQPLPVEP